MHTVLRQLNTERSTCKLSCSSFAAVAAWQETAFSSRAAPQTWLSLEREKKKKKGKNPFRWKTKFAESHWIYGETQNQILVIFQGQSCEVSNDNYNLPLANWPSGQMLCPPVMQLCCRTGVLTPLAGWLESCWCHQGTCSHWVLPGSSKWQELFLLKGALLRLHFA